MVSVKKGSVVKVLHYFKVYIQRIRVKSAFGTDLVVIVLDALTTVNDNSKHKECSKEPKIKPGHYQLLKYSNYYKKNLLSKYYKQYKTQYVHLCDCLVVIEFGR